MADQALVVTEDDVRAMLLAGDSIVGQAGRSMLAKVLKGSRDKKLLAIGLDKSAGYGYFRSLTLDQITERVDWMILHDFFAIDYDRDMPLLVFTDRGWEIQIENMTELMLKQWEMWADTVPQDLDMTYLKDLNRSMILLFLEKVARTHDARYLPLLRQWAPIDYRKVREAIGKVIDYLEQGNSESPLMLEGAYRSFYYTPGEPLIEPRGSERLKCWECGKRFEWTVEEQDKFRMRGWKPPKRCESCRENRHGQREAWL
ncbi:RQC-minor-1 family DNA-binding protein [Cohnella phaseoli]|uniref:RQC domain-containing protein n=1 Tax=Cohnella phaseoli TaxID=456490 RepID=A0A3D9JNN8_9BACL|nr:RQC-minor-1 family DNA-binding protein [Cohnella phaseoli]RED75672.1 RQC domain-containing protein [Cohnella phaseoli]